VILAWCIEILQAAFLVADDIMDNSSTRRGRTCWYREPDIGTDGVNDALILESFVYFLLRQYFGSGNSTPSNGVQAETYYAQLVDLYHEATLQTEMGQMLDLVSQPQGNRRRPNQLQTFNLQSYKRIVRYKTAYYSFYLPCASAMILCGLATSRELDAARDICIELGEKFQIQDDWLDCFGDETVMGKRGTDIQDHKCTWLIVMVLQRCNDAQRAFLQEHYGKSEEASVTAVKDLYRESQIPELYARQETESYARIDGMIRNYQHIIPVPVFKSILLLIHNRSK